MSMNRVIVCWAVIAFLFPLLLFSCHEGEPDRTPPGEAIVIIDEAAPAAVWLAAQRFAELLGEVLPVSIVAGDPGPIPPCAHVFTLGPGPWTREIIGRDELDALPEQSYILRRGTIQGRPALAAAGSDLLGHQYAVYALLTELGYGFFHPEETFIPGSLSIPDALDAAETPSYLWRGFHQHTMHPVELMDSLLVPSDQGLAEAWRYVDWLVANRANYLQWALLRTVDMEVWIPHATAIVEYAHTRGLRVGIDVSYRFIQQNTYLLIPGPGPWEDQLRAGFDRVLEVPFDVINVEMGTSEFIPASDTLTMDWFNTSVDYLQEVRERTGRDVELIVKVHCSTGQTAPNYGDINFNFLPGLADPRVGVMPHTVQFYDLFRPAPTYDNEDFSHILDFLLDEIGERRVLYYPETAYWVSFDVDIPLFLPQYVYSRWNDLHRLRNSGMDGQIVFSSGLEWGYWLNDFAAAHFAFEADDDWQEPVRRFVRIFGPTGDEVYALLCEITEAQGRDLLEGNLIAYLIGYETADDIGLLVDIHAQPEKVLFSELRRWGRPRIRDFERGVLTELGVLAGTVHAYCDRLSALRAEVPREALPWFEELLAGLEITALRADHVHGLYRGVVAGRKAELGMADEGRLEAQRAFAEAVAARIMATELISRRESSYRYPPERLARFRENPTAYEFGYLYPAHTCFYWLRDEAKAIDGNPCPCHLNITNLIDGALGEGPIGTWLEELPPLASECLDACFHPREVPQD